MVEALVFTDLDGTLLDHSTYSFAPAEPAIAKLRDLAIPLVLVSSKTMVELSPLAAELQTKEPFVAENGGAVFLPARPHSFAGSAQAGSDAAPIVEASSSEEVPGPALPGSLSIFAKAYPEIRQILETLREKLELRYRGFGDMDAQEVAELTGLSLEAAEHAKLRTATEPLLWQDDEVALRRFTEALKSNGLNLVRGGRFLHVQGPFTKAQAMEWLIERYAPLQATAKVRPPVTIAAGDSPNDHEMLAAADIALVVPRPNGTRLDVHGKHATVFAEHPGPLGWNFAMHQVLDIELERVAATKAANATP